MATITETELAPGGINPDTPMAAASSGGDSYANTGRQFVRIKNAHASVTRTVTVDVIATVEDLTIPDRDVSIPALSERWIGPFPTATYGPTVTLTYDTEADLTLALFDAPVT